MTLHPSDVCEYTPLASERCHDIFRTLHFSLPLSRTQVESEEVVLEKTLAYVLEPLDSNHFTRNTIDHIIVQAYYALLSSQTNTRSGRDILKATLEKFESSEHGVDAVSAQHTASTNSSA